MGLYLLRLLFPVLYFSFPLQMLLKLAGTIQDPWEFHPFNKDFSWTLQESNPTLHLVASIWHFSLLNKIPRFADSPIEKKYFPQ